MKYKQVLVIICSLLCIACTDVESDPIGLGLGDLDPESGKAVFGNARDFDAKEDGFSGKTGLPSEVDNSDTAVWEVYNQWSDTHTEAARKSGLAWNEDSGLNWDEKYALWVKDMVKIDSHSHGKTFQLTTPFGKILPAPSIECAETSLFLRATFASWYHLPFFIEARDSRGNRLYLGHFGFRTDTGRYSTTPRFKTNYHDFSDLLDELPTIGWPEDTKLRRRHLGGSQDDDQPFLFEGASAGTYFDEIFLNKRVGHFMIFLLSYFGSVNLADPSNTFNIKPEAIREGDTLLHRWQRRGIGHTMVVKSLTIPSEGFFEIELVSGSMPRRQPKWESPSDSKYNLTVSKAGGLAESNDGVPYARLGGGLKRWRIAQLQNNRWTNMVPQADRDNFISSGDIQRLGERLDTFDELIKELPPEQKREAILSRIDDARRHLQNYPASCAARIRREEAFTELYELEETEFYTFRDSVDQTYRKLEDYVFAALSYDESKTCCWNSTTDAMYEIIMTYALSEQSQEMCITPTVFKAIDGGFDIWSTYASEIGRSDEWVNWSEDESCPQRDQKDDVIHPEWIDNYCMTRPIDEARHDSQR